MRKAGVVKTTVTATVPSPLVTGFRIPSEDGGEVVIGKIGEVDVRLVKRKCQAELRTAIPDFPHIVVAERPTYQEIQGGLRVLRSMVERVRAT